jgi:hypothetical protein
MANNFEVAVYYFPNYHPSDARNQQLHGHGWSEWELVKRAEPRFPGHLQPRVPLWGYEDESDPAVMARKIDAAADHGISSFIFDWYWYNDGPFLERGLDNGFLGAPNNTRMKFALMWANHDWIDIHPARRRECAYNQHTLLYPGAFTPQTFEEATQNVIERYFKHPSYWCIDGAPYFSIYDLPMLVKSLGGVEATRLALANFRERTRAAGFPDLHLNQVLWNVGVLPGETEIREPGEMLPLLGFDSFTSYVWIHHVPLNTFPETDYNYVSEQYMQYWEQIGPRIPLPYYPNATMGWDSSPRTQQTDIFTNAGYPFMPSLSDNTPENFQQSLQAIKTRLETNGGPNIVTINAWNEWTEGSYLEPDIHYGMGYLEAIRNVFLDKHQEAGNE